METNKTSISRGPALLAAILIAVFTAGLGLGSCQMWSKDDPVLISDDIVGQLESSLLKSHAMLQGSGGASAGLVPRMLSARPLTPFGGTPSINGSVAMSETVMKATINRLGATGEFTGGTLSHYPEPGQTTTFTVEPHGSLSDVYIISATTAYPSTSPASTTLEIYLVKDVSPGDPLGPKDDIWNEHDPIVDDTGAVDSKYRITYQTTFRDGSVRNETILSDTASDGIAYAAFDVNDTLDYPPVFVPAEGTANYSSVVLFSHERTNNLDYWFWKGTRYQNTVGIRYYTEQVISDGAAVLQGTMVIFEKTLEELVTLGGSLADSLADIYVGGQNELLALVVTRQLVKFDNTNTAIDKTTRTRATVYDVSGNMALYLEKQNDAAATGDLFADDTSEPSVVERETAIDNDPYGIPLITTSPPAGDLGTLYAAIENQAVPTQNGITGSGEAYEFSGQNGIVNADSGAGSAYDLTTAGTVEAWVKLDTLRPWAAVIHKGVREDFTDEIYSLQFWSKGSDTAFVLNNAANNNYILLQAAGTHKTLKTNTWYYIVATWDTSVVELYINGVKAASKSNSFYPSPGVRENDAPVVVGAQFADSSQVYKSYFGLDGIIDSWKVKKSRTSGADILAEYQRVTGG